MKTVEQFMSNAKFNIGLYNVEDIIQIPGTNWIVGGGITCYGPNFWDKVITTGFWHLFDAEKETGFRVDSSTIEIAPEGDRFPLATPPVWNAFSPHGFDFYNQTETTIEVYVASHKSATGESREAVEVFRIDYSKEIPTFTWIGGIEVAEDFWPDAVALLPDGGVVATSTGNPLMPQEESIKLALSGAPIGNTRVWYKSTGWQELEGSEGISTPNGIVISKDGQQIYVAASTGFSVVKIDRSVSPVKVTSMDLGGIPDNLRWSEDGKSILAGIHVVENPMDFAKEQEVAAEYGGNQMTAFKVTRINPETLELTEVMPPAVYGVLGAGTSAIEVGNRIWVGSTKSDRVGIFDLK
ncbi:hypothetical protein [Flammeovirga sp. SJP92]|uniref:hypothetical protein n=1 Tax=Flammeovirga sp. SJP92 TaxID=1775430 RepID=UPI000788C9C8|nr:hypothetical protein [Flammeovirga sp. SJP92]KXX67631.1 hypothetical protein AVL50_26595 [Flammeovirga sp. SJP92]